MPIFIEKFNKTIIFFVVYTLIFLIFFKTLSYTIPFVLALIFALILKKPTLYLVNKFKFSHTMASLTTCGIFFLTFVVILFFSISSIIQELIQLTKNIQVYFALNPPDFNSLFENITKYYNNLDPMIVNTLKNGFSDVFTKISSATVLITGWLVSFLFNFASMIPYLIMLIIFTIFATYFFTKDLTTTKIKFLTRFSENNTDRLSFILQQVKKMFLNYLVAYSIIIFITFLETLIIFTIFKIKYAFLLAFISAIFDILPVFGIAAVYGPLALITFFQHNFVASVGLLLSWAVIVIIRHIIEPRIVSSSLGLHPVSVLAAIFIGLNVNGVAGMFFCMFFIVFYNIFKKINLI